MWTSSPATYNAQQLVASFHTLAEWMIRAPRWTPEANLVLRAMRARLGQLCTQGGGADTFPQISLRMPIGAGGNDDGNMKDDDEDDMGDLERLADGNDGNDGRRGGRQQPIYTLGEEGLLVAAIYDRNLRWAVNLPQQVLVMPRAKIIADVANAFCARIRRGQLARTASSQRAKRALSTRGKGRRRPGGRGRGRGRGQHSRSSEDSYSRSQSQSQFQSQTQSSTSTSTSRQTLDEWIAEQCRGQKAWLSRAHETHMRPLFVSMCERGILPMDPTEAARPETPLPDFMCPGWTLPADQGGPPDDALTLIACRMHRLILAWLWHCKGDLEREYRKAFIHAVREGSLCSGDRVYIRRKRGLEVYRKVDEIAMERHGLNGDISAWNRRRMGTCGLTCFLWARGPSRQGWSAGLLCIFSRMIELQDGIRNHGFDSLIVSGRQLVRNPSRILYSDYPYLWTMIGGHALIWKGHRVDTTPENPWEVLALWLTIMRQEHPLNRGQATDHEMRIDPDGDTLSHVWTQVAPWSKWSHVLDDIDHKM